MGNELDHVEDLVVPDETANALPTTDDSVTGNHATNGTPDTTTPQKLSCEIVMLRARCSNLRHWCRLMLEDPASAGVLPDSTVAELNAVAPEVSQDEGHDVVVLLARGGQIEPTHPLAPTTNDPVVLRAAISQLTVERERLRQEFFKLYDHIYHDDDLSEDFLLEQIAQGSGRSISDIIADFTGKMGANS